jgi:predicted site-specific integrase-resolvase
VTTDPFVRIDGAPYFTLKQAAKVAGVSRQTLLSWRKAGKVPAGERRREIRILYDHNELEQVRQYASRREST